VHKPHGHKTDVSEEDVTLQVNDPFRIHKTLERVSASLTILTSYDKREIPEYLLAISNVIERCNEQVTNEARRIEPHNRTERSKTLRFVSLDLNHKK
jgi:hypothetical protein